MAATPASPSTTRTSTGPTMWERTKGYSNTAYEKALKPGFNKAYAVVDKLGAPVNRMSNRVGAESFWPTTLDKESEKAARILRAFCKDGFYEQIEEKEAQKVEDREATTVGVPQGKQRVMVKIPAKVVKNCVGMAIFTTMRTGWLFGGSGGSGVLVARHPDTGEWSPPSGIHTQNLSFGFLAGVDIYDSVLVINSRKALEAFTKLRTTLGTEVGVAAGPVGIGGSLDTEVTKRQSPIWSYVKSRGLYAGIALEGNMVIERTDENERFYGERVGVSDILIGKLRHPPVEQYQVLMDTLKAAQGDQVDDSLLPQGDSPSDMELMTEGKPGTTFGIPAEDDPDPFGVKALAAEGLNIREAGTHQRPSADAFDFKPSPTSPIYTHFSRKSVDTTSFRSTWRESTHSLNSVTRGTQTDDDDSVSTPQSPRAGLAKSMEMPQKHSQLVNEYDEQKTDDDRRRSISDVDSDAEISTAVPVMARARVVEVPKRLPPALPPRNPGRVVSVSADVQPPVDGFDQVTLNGTGDDKQEKTTSPEVHPKADGDSHKHEDKFESVPTTPIEEKKPSEIPGSFH